ncbi:MAG: hypothetical protein IPM16_09750 [Chloroflexi bacterium]|nr:hypothetical protein [Chloroflexota bacterium]
MENMPDFDSMTPEEMMAWMEALAKRQGATEGLTTSADMDVPEIDPSSVEIDEPGYIPYGMDPEVWAQKKAVEDEARAARIAAMRSETKGAPEPQAEHEPELEPESDATNPLQFLAELSGVSEADEFELPDAIGEDAVETAPEADDILASLSGISDAGQIAEDWMPDLEAAPDLGALDSLDFGSLEGLDDFEPAAADDQLEWLESLVSEPEVDEPEALKEDLEFGIEGQADAFEEMDEEMLLEDSDILEDSAVSAVLNDSMDWLSDFADTQSMERLAEQAAASKEVLDASDDLDAFFDRIGDDDLGVREDDEPSDVDVAAGIAVRSALPTIEVPGLGDVSDALETGADVPPEDVEAWMGSLLDQGIQREDVVDEDEEAAEALDDEAVLVQEDLPSWLVEQVGPPPTDAELAETGDLPDWLTAPVSDEQSAEFEEMFNQMSAQPAAEEAPELDFSDIEVVPLDTGAIRVQMDDPWVEAFELEREERLTDTGRLAAWYDSAAHEVEAARAATEPVSSAEVDEPESVEMPAVQLETADLPVEDELPPGEPQSIPSWMEHESTIDEGAAMSTAMPTPVNLEDELPDWLKQAQLESDEVGTVPSWLSESLSTEEYKILNPEPSADAAPAEPSPIIAPAPSTAAPRRSEPTRPAAERLAAIPLSEAANVINQARASLKLGDVNAMLDSYDRLIRSEVALEEVEIDVERVTRDPVHKTNPAVLRVYGDVLLRRGKLQQALDTYRAALNLL